MADTKKKNILYSKEGGTMRPKIREQHWIGETTHVMLHVGLSTEQGKIQKDFILVRISDHTENSMK